MTRFVNRNLEGLVQSPIRYMTRECRRLGGINLGQGLCDLPTPPRVAEGAKRAIDERHATYSLPEGVPELRERLAEKLRRDNGLEVEPHGEIVVTVGTTGAYGTVLHGLLNPGDGILLFEPYYGYHLNAAIVAGMKPELATLEPPDFELDEALLRSAITEDTRAVVLCTPSNPSGRMMRPDEIEAVARVAREHDLLVLTDEIYEYFVYDRPHVSPATVADLRERTVSIMGLSKTFHITGWRVGYAVAPPELAHRMTLVNDLLYVCAPTPLQYAVAADIPVPEEDLRALRESFRSKRDRLCDALSSAGLEPIVPEGAYYVLADVRRLGQPSAQDAAMDLLERGGVAAVPGTAFYRGETGEGLLRFAFGVEDEQLDEACRRIRRYGGAS